MAAQAAPDHLLAQKLGAERADAQNVGDGVGVPSLGQHGHGHHAANLLAEAAGTADRVHHLAQQCSFARFALRGAGALAGRELALELLDLWTCGFAESLVERVAGLDLAGVDQERARAGEPAALIVVVAEQLEMAGMEGRAFAFLGVAALEAGDPLEHQLGDGGVLADHDEDRRHANPRALPALELACVMAVERGQPGPEHGRQVKGAELGGARGGLRQVLADMLPEIAVDDRVDADEVVAHRHAGQLHDAALDRVHQAEIRHDPGEEIALGIARTPQEEGRGREVVDGAHALRQLAVQRLDAVDPEPRGFLVLGRLLLVVAGQRALGVGANLVAIAVVGLVVDDVDAVVVEQLATGPLQHLRVRFRRFERLRIVSLQEASRDFRERQRLPMLKGVIVGDDDLRAPDLRQHFRRRDLAGLIIVVRLARQQYAKPILDCDTGRDDQEGAGEILGVLPRSVDRLPGDQHGHDGRLAAPGRHLHGQAEEFGIGLLVGFGDLIQKTLRRRALRRDLGKPDDRLDGFNLAEERGWASELMMAPVLQKSLRYARDAPIGWVAQGPPSSEIATDLVDKRVFGIGFEV